MSELSRPLLCLILTTLAAALCLVMEYYERNTNISFKDVLGRALGQSDSEEVELGSDDEVMEDVDDGVKEKPKINIFSVAFNVGTVVVTGISIVLIWVLPQQEGQDASKVQNEKRPTKVAKHEAVDNDVTLESDEKIDQTSNSTQPIT